MSGNKAPADGKDGKDGRKGLSARDDADAPKWHGCVRLFIGGFAMLAALGAAALAMMIDEKALRAR